MPQWAAFAGLTGAVLVFLLVLARLSQAYVTDGPERTPADRPGRGPDPAAERGSGVGGGNGSPDGGENGGPDGGGSGSGVGSGNGAGTRTQGGSLDPDPVPPADPATGRETSSDDEVGTDAGPTATDPTDDAPPEPSTRTVVGETADRDHPGPAPVARDRDGVGASGPGEMSPGVLLANVALSQGLLLALLALGAWLFRIPAPALGLADLSSGVWLVGAALGVALYAANEVGAAAADRLGVGHDERLRELLAPDSARGWGILLGGALPVVAGFEELLFRAALVGAVPAGFGVSPWAMAVLSSVAFGLGHGAQGRGGIAVTGALGLALAAAFVLTGSLVVVFVAHYLVNALEFVVHEGLGIEWVE